MLEKEFKESQSSLEKAMRWITEQRACAAAALTEAAEEHLKEVRQLKGQIASLSENLPGEKAS